MTTKKPAVRSSLFLKDLKCDVYLGWPEQERSQKQQIGIDIEIHFLQLPLGCNTDNLADTTCYDQLIKTINQFINQRKFKLIEHLGQELYQCIKDQFVNAVSLKVNINKTIQGTNLAGGVCFTYGDDSI